MLLSSHTCNPLCSSTCISLRSSLVHAVPITKILGREPCSPSTMPGWLTHGGLARLGWDARAPHTMSFRALLASSGQGHYSLSLSCDDFLGFHAQPLFSYRSVLRLLLSYQCQMTWEDMRIIFVRRFAGFAVLVPPQECVRPCR